MEMTSMQATVDVVPTKVLVVDDHPMVCAFLKDLIGSEQDMNVVGYTGKAEEALDLVKQESPDLAIVDISLESGNGLALIKRVRVVNDSVKFLVFSTHDEKLYAQRALDAGAKGFLNKQEDLPKIMHAIRKVLNGDVYLSDTMTSKLLQDFYDSGKKASDVPGVSRLSNRELEVYEMIGRGITTSEIASQLHLSVKTIETHREKIKKKLRLGSAIELTRNAMQWVMDQG